MALVLKPLIAEKAKRNMSLAGGDKKSDAYKSPSTNLSKAIEHIDTRRDIAKAAGVSQGTINKVEQIKKTAAPEVVEAARKNDISIDAAATIAELPVEEQREIVRKPKEEVRKAVKQAREKKAKSKSQPSPSTKKSKQEPVIEYASHARDFATIAISQLERMNLNDPQRIPELKRVREWINKQLGGE